MFEIERQRERLLEQLDRLDERAAAVARFGEDEFEEGAVITWSRIFPDNRQRYHYAAVKAADAWWTTGKSTVPYTWARLVDQHLSRSDDAAWVDTVEEF